MVKRYYLLDTNIISEPTRPQPNKSVLECLERYETVSAISAITYQELKYGLELVQNKIRRTELERYLYNVVRNLFPVVPYDDSAAAVHADLRAHFKTHGTPTPIFDTQIAATAIAHNMILVTRNTKDFEHIPHLLLENWFA